jgi:3-dehydroquinate synthase
MHYLVVNIKSISSNYKIYYDISINQLAEVLECIVTNKQIVIVTDTNVAKFYLAKLVDLLSYHQYQVLPIIIPHGEKSKNIKTKEFIEKKMFENNIHREALLIAFGGGVVGDIGGFVASTYMRGIKYIQIPTTLLAMIDSSIGGKTAINNKYGKNLIGSYYQPKLVFGDISFLSTLSKKHIKNGIIEAIKIFLTFDKEYFYYIYNNIDKLYRLDNSFIYKVIFRAIELKKQVIECDEKDGNTRLSLNFGHTIGHAIEKITNYKLLHGYGVAIGIIIEAMMSVELNYLDKDDFLIIVDLIKNKLKINLDILSNYPIGDIIATMYLDKKVSNNKISCVLLQSIGQIAINKDGCVLTEINQDVIEYCLHNYKHVI